MPYRQRIALLTSLLILGVGYLYAYVPARYLPEAAQPYAALDHVDLGRGIQDEAANLRPEHQRSGADAYTASALDALTKEAPAATSSAPSRLYE